MNAPFAWQRSQLDAVPIDHAYLVKQVPCLKGRAEAVRYYLKNGLSGAIDPTPFYMTDWYAWQNPDWSRAHDAPYLHYLDIGRKEGRDPSPFVDMTRYLEATGGAIATEAAYDAIIGGLRCPALGVYETPEDLRRCQRAFFSGISVCAHRMRPPYRPRPALVVCQTGPGALLDGWAHDPGREWDLMLNYYDSSGFRPGLGDYAVFQKGTKFTAMRLLLDRFPQTFDIYDHVLFIDDDVATTSAALNALFAACRTYGLDLAQMTLTSDSSCNWSDLFARDGNSGPRPVSAVEIMMPVFSRRALGWVSQTLGQSVSGFGLDLVWGHIVSEQGGRIAVLDDVSATHARPVDQSGGAYYRYLRRNGLNAKAELWTLLRTYGADRHVVSPETGA